MELKIKQQISYKYLFSLGFPRLTRSMTLNTGPWRAKYENTGHTSMSRVAASRTAPPMSMRKPISLAYGMGLIYAPYDVKALQMPPWFRIVNVRKKKFLACNLNQLPSWHEFRLKRLYHWKEIALIKIHKITWLV